MLRFIALRGVQAHENVKHSKRRENVIYRDRNRIIELLLQLENKQEIMQKFLKSFSLCQSVLPTSTSGLGSTKVS